MGNKKLKINDYGTFHRKQSPVSRSEFIKLSFGIPPELKTPDENKRIIIFNKKLYNYY
jgi:hypothetical protein